MFFKLVMHCLNVSGCTMSSNATLVHGALSRDVCAVEMCDSGVITSTQQQCHVPCVSPLPPPTGHCCPACPGQFIMTFTFHFNMVEIG